LDQSIYAFRDGERTHLEAFAETYAAANRLALTGNFRSSPAICSLAASLRGATTADVSCGPTQNVDHPVAIYPYGGRTVSSAIGRWFADYAEEESIGIPRANLIILAHSTRAAQIAAGSGATAIPGTSKIERLARAVGEFWAGTTRHGKAAALTAIETLLLEVQGLRNDGEPLSRAIERSGLDVRLLRRQALELAMRLPKRCPDTDRDRATWVECARNLLRELGIPIADGQTIPGFLRMPSGADWSRCLEETATSCGVPYSTIHNAKGGEYPGVCVVIPPNDSRNFTTQFSTAWEGRTESESKRVVYVGVTRAMTLAALAIPSAFLARCETILETASVPYIVCS
jgi:DNA helicase-2/ATP-dependent DNA helicase PcrA